MTGVPDFFVSVLVKLNVFVIQVLKAITLMNKSWLIGENSLVELHVLVILIEKWNRYYDPDKIKLSGKSS